MTFSDIGLSAELLRALVDQGYTTPTPVQAQAIPVVLAGRDLMATAQTGTGKTAAFTLPLLQRLAAATPARGRTRALILVPTRELAAQVTEAVRTYGRHLQLRCTAVYGGVNIGPQIRDLRAGADIVVATPGRLMDHLERRSVDLSNIQTLVLDEADRMLDMGFMPAIERIVKQLPRVRQTLLFSATFSDPIRKLAQRFMTDPQVVDVARRNAAADAVRQSAYAVDQARKRDLLAHLFDDLSWQQVLVFTRTKHGADRLAKQLDKAGIQATAIHGNKSQNQRTRALNEFKRMKVRALVATDVAARGLDIDELPHVVNFDLPNNPEDYVHRIGRTGRAGQSGEAISLVCGEERSLFGAIKKLVKLDIPIAIVKGFEPGQRSAVDAQPGRQSASEAPRRNGNSDRRPAHAKPRHQAASDSRNSRHPGSDGRSRQRHDRPQGSQPNGNKHPSKGGRRSVREFATLA